MKSNNASSTGLGIPSVLLIIFIVLKLTGLITWSWWWVLSPIWIGFLLIGAIFILYVLIIAWSKS